MSAATEHATPNAFVDQIAVGAQVVVRDEEWLVRAVQHTPSDGLMVHCTGTTTLVRDAEATFFTSLDLIEPLRPEDTDLVVDESAHHRDSRLYLEAMIRKTPVPATERRLTVASGQLLNDLQYQRRAAVKALDGLRPRLLIADAVGLGKTLEVGMILAELIRRGRGERILVVTPRHILEQFQHEMWTRFAIPLVRLDSEGIQRVRRRIPAGRNPFTYYRRAIISIDTLKNVGRYRHHLENIRWDAVVIDECHNLMNRGALRNQLARVLAPRTDALLMLSATPHNGDPESFAELIRLLDPTAVADPTAVCSSDIEHLYVRRHKGNDEVAAEVGHRWADRLAPRPLPVPPTPAEEAIFDELAHTWLHPPAGTRAPTSGTGASLFPWTLFKAALSSHRALADTVRARRHTLAGAAGTPVDPDRAAEDVALARLGDLAEQVGDHDAAKLTALVDQLTDIGVGPRSATRCVVFSERIATLNWLADTVPGALGLSADQVRVLHGGMADVRQMDVIEEFGLAESPVRLLLTGDMASEGVNLHRQCHHLIHFDLPWSLITIEQRNGRIDRYGQEHRPDIRALVVTPDALAGDVRVLSKLLHREDEAHRAFGESGSLLGLHAAQAEEDAIARALRDGDDLDRVIPAEPTAPLDIITILTGGTGSDPVPERTPPSLFDSTFDFVDEALSIAVDDPSSLDIRTDPSDPTFRSFLTPPDLARRLAALPQSYLAEQGLTERIRLTADRDVAQQRLDVARSSTDSQWPDIAYLSPLHPVIDWLVDKLLVKVGRNQAPVLHARVSAPTFCVQGLWSNGQGRPQLVEWLTVTPVPGAEPVVGDLFEQLTAAGVGPSMPNPGRSPDVAALRSHLDDVVQAARAEMGRRRAEHDRRIDELLAGPSERLGEWVQRSEQLALELDDRRRDVRRRHIDDVQADTRRLIDSLRSTGEPMVRVLAVLVPV
ncbi:MAG TPA: DEAD/DEAH box helicase [Microthrixaceae bacterium]|nr:DEAD/DEAH box helicase [Microthrixaceae bacterium]